MTDTITTTTGREFRRAPKMNPTLADSDVRREVAAFLPDAEPMFGALSFEKGYVTFHVAQSAVSDYRELLRKVVGDEKADQMAEMIAKRPTGDSVHVTAIDPKEARVLSKKGVKLSKEASIAGTVEVRALGLGMKQEDEMETWFVVCESDDINAFRASLGLEPKQFHITLGFTHKDLFTPGGKGLASLLYIG